MFNLALGKPSSKYEALKIRLLAVETLKLLKRLYSYRELSEITGVSESVLCRYVRGQTVPSLDQSLSILQVVSSKLDLGNIVASRIGFVSGGFIDTTEVVTDPVLLKLIALHMVFKLAGRRITKVLVPESSGVPLATMIAEILEVPLIVARRYRDKPHEDYVEAVVSEPGLRATITYYIPRRCIRRRDDVLLVDDVVQSGKTLSALVDAITKLGARPAGTAVIVAVGEPQPAPPKPFITVLRV